MTDVVCEVLIDASPATIYPFLVDADQHLKWIGTQATLDAVVGGEYRVLVMGVHPGVGKFLVLVPNERVVFTFGWDEPDHPIPAGSGEIEITLTPDGAMTLVRLVHRGLPDDAVSDHTGGWNHYLGRLKQVVAGEDPGPDLSSDD
jgi:uncharacterized protein YndB with AHSA1/START domain